MLRRLKPGSAEFKAGVFIIISLALLVFSILWLRYFAISPEKQIIARFKDPGPVEAGIPVYYQGVNVGRVPKVGFSDDFVYTYVYIDIYNKELKLPSNITARVKIEGIAGQKYVCLSYPEKPVGELLASGDIIEGESPFGLDDIQDFFKQEFESGRFQRAMKDFQASLANADKATAEIERTSRNINTLMFKYDREIQGIIRDTSGVTAGVNETIANVNRVVESPEFQLGVKETIMNANSLLQNTNANTQRVFSQIQQNNVIPNFNTTLCKTYATLEEAEKAMQNTSQVACTFDCVGKKASQMLSQRFLLFKLMFGRPGEPLEECQGVSCCP